MYISENLHKYWDINYEKNRLFLSYNAQPWTIQSAQPYLWRINASYATLHGPMTELVCALFILITSASSNIEITEAPLKEWQSSSWLLTRTQPQLSHSVNQVWSDRHMAARLVHFMMQDMGVCVCKDVCRSIDRSQSRCHFKSDIWFLMNTRPWGLEDNMSYCNVPWSLFSRQKL